jgi:hypothetical protein
MVSTSSSAFYLALFHYSTSSSAITASYLLDVSTYSSYFSVSALNYYASSSYNYLAGATYGYYGYFVFFMSLSGSTPASSSTYFISTSSQVLGLSVLITSTSTFYYQYYDQSNSIQYVCNVNTATSVFSCNQLAAFTGTNSYVTQGKMVSATNIYFAGWSFFNSYGTYSMKTAYVMNTDYTKNCVYYTDTVTTPSATLLSVSWSSYSPSYINYNGNFVMYYAYLTSNSISSSTPYKFPCSTPYTVSISGTNMAS